MKVTLGVSRRHVHLTQEVWTTLFGEEPMVKRNELGQPGQFATTSKVDVSEFPKSDVKPPLIATLKHI